MENFDAENYLYNYANEYLYEDDVALFETLIVDEGIEFRIWYF